VTIYLKFSLVLIYLFTGIQLCRTPVFRGCTGRLFYSHKCVLFSCSVDPEEMKQQTAMIKKEKWLYCQNDQKYHACCIEEHNFCSLCRRCKKEGFKGW